MGLIKKACFNLGLFPKTVRKTNCEARLHAMMVSQGIYPEWQYKISQMYVDFAFPKYHLVIEVDGKHHQGEPLQKEKDDKRDAILRTFGWQVLRYTNDQVYTNVDWVVNHIKRRINRRR